MNNNELLEDVRNHLSDYRYTHSVEVAKSAAELAERFGGDVNKAALAGYAHDILKEQSRFETLDLFVANGVKLTKVEMNAPKLWHAMAGAVYLQKKYGLDDDIISAVRYHTTGKAGMTQLEKILFVADFISADRDYNGVEEMRERAKISLEFAMEEGLRFTINELSEKCLPIHPDTVSCYNEIVLEEKERRQNNG